MKLLVLCSLSLFMALAPSAVAGTEADRLRKVLIKRDHEIAELRKEIDGLHRQLAEEQPIRLANADQGAAPAANPKPISNDTQPGVTQMTYVVVAGDTLSGIAKRHKTSVAILKRDNRLNSHIIRLGQKLKVSSMAAGTPTEQQVKIKKQPVEQPEAPGTPTRDYKIKAGDTFYSIARKEGMTISELKTLNPDTNASRLRIGQKIKLSGSSTSSTAPLPDQPVANLLENEQSITILARQEPSKEKAKSIAEVELKKEMTFSDFAKQEGMSMDRLNELNGHNLAASEWLAAGSVFYVER